MPHRSFGATAKFTAVLFTLMLWALALPVDTYGSLDVIAVARKSVVAVRVQGEGGRVFEGSGFVVGKNGIIVTSSYLAGHAAADASRISVQTDKGGPVVAEQIILSDENLGLALLRVPAQGLQPAKLAPDYKLKKGDHFYVVGSPTASTPLVLGGTVKTLPRNGLLELDLKVPPENDGGPVMNTKGEVIGIIIDRRANGRSVRIVMPVKQLSEMLASYRKKHLATAYFELGLLYDAEQGRTADAAAALRESVRIDPDYADAYNNLGVIYGKMGSYPEAIEAFNQVLRLKPDFAEALFNLGIVLNKTGQLKEAAEAFNHLLRIRPGDADTLNRLSIVYGKLGQYGDAADSAERAVRLRPDYAEAYNSLGIAYGSLGLNAEAVGAFRKALKIRPDYCEARYLLAVVFLSTGDSSAAKMEYELLRSCSSTLAERLANLPGIKSE